MIAKNVIDFLNAHATEIDNNEWYDIFEDMWVTFGVDNSKTIIEMLRELDEDEVELAAVVSYIKWRVEFESSYHGLYDPSNSWSRLNWMIDCYPFYAYLPEYNDIYNELLKEKDWVGIKTLKPLDLEYSWNGEQDYDLGWFKPEEYKEIV